MEEKLKILVKYHDNYKGEPLQKIEKITVGDWIDLRSAEELHLSRDTSVLVHLGVSMKLPEGYEAHIVPRSSTFKKWGIIQTNSIGIIDNSYSGDDDEWMMPIYTVTSTDIYKNDRICQFRIVKKMSEVEFEEVDHLDGPNRGGFGSTGTK